MDPFKAVSVLWLQSPNHIRVVRCNTDEGFKVASLSVTHYIAQITFKMVSIVMKYMESSPYLNEEKCSCDTPICEENWGQEFFHVEMPCGAELDLCEQPDTSHLLSVLDDCWYLMKEQQLKGDWSHEDDLVLELMRCCFYRLHLIQQEGNMVCEGWCHMTTEVQEELEDLRMGVEEKLKEFIPEEIVLRTESPRED